MNYTGNNTEKIKKKPTPYDYFIRMVVYLTLLLCILKILPHNYIHGLSWWVVTSPVWVTFIFFTVVNLIHSFYKFIMTIGKNNE